MHIVAQRYMGRLCTVHTGLATDKLRDKRSAVPRSNTITSARVVQEMRMTLTTHYSGACSALQTMKQM